MERRDVVLVVGADGLIGRALSTYLVRAGKSVFETTRRLDIISEKRVFLDLTEDVTKWCPPCHVSVAFLCAAKSSLEHCQREPAESAKVNVHNIVELTKSLVPNGTFVIFLSSNLVYDGSVPFQKADDPVSPQTEYGRQKAEAERQLLPLGDLISVTRFTKVLGPNMPMFKRWTKELQNNQAIHPFSDMVIAPVPLSFAVDVLDRIAEVRLPGIVQVSGEKDVTYEEVGRYIAQRLGASLDLVQPIRSDEKGLNQETVPSHTTFDTTRLRTELGMEPPDVWHTIEMTITQVMKDVWLGKKGSHAQV